jgi:hypothetical protein
MCGSTRFGRLSTHHQKRTTALGASGFTVGALLVVVWTLIDLFELYDDARTCERQT